MKEVICYPTSFPQRPEDRLLLGELRAQGIPSLVAESMLYRIWRDFATGGSDRRDLSDPRQVRALELFCEWPGDSGQLVEMAVDAGFLAREEASVVLKDFYPINAGLSGNSKAGGYRKAAYQRAVRNHLPRAKKAALDQLALWERNKAVLTVAPEAAKEALLFLHRVARAVDLAVPRDQALRDLLPKASDVACRQDATETDLILRWLISRRQDPQLPRDLGLLLDRWDLLAVAAAQES